MYILKNLILDLGVMEPLNRGFQISIFYFLFNYNDHLFLILRAFLFDFLTLNFYKTHLLIKHTGPDWGKSWSIKNVNVFWNCVVLKLAQSIRNLHKRPYFKISSTRAIALLPIWVPTYPCSSNIKWSWHNFIYLCYHPLS